MGDYISREEALMAVTRAKLPDATPDGVPIANGKRSVTDCVRRLKEIPAADVRPVRRGKWSRVYDDFMKSNYDTCSCCGKEYFGANGFNFCPNCGADMREPPKEERA